MENANSALMEAQKYSLTLFASAVAYRARNWRWISLMGPLFIEILENPIRTIRVAIGQKRT